MSVPNSWTFALLALAAYRLTRLIGWDTILDKPRNWLVKREAQWTPTYKEEFDKFIHCPWCMGFWVCAGWWLLWQQWPHAILVISTPLAINALVGLGTKNLDE